MERLSSIISPKPRVFLVVIGSSNGNVGLVLRLLSIRDFFLISGCVRHTRLINSRREMISCP
jgi:hypothetical protein